jgi:hypothetical protein
LIKCSRDFLLYSIDFNHFIKLNDKSIVSREFLYKLIARGAAVLWGGQQQGVDIIIPFLFRNDRLNTVDVSAIFVQVNNDVTDKDDPKTKPFDFMDPFELGFFRTRDDLVPVIRGSSKLC